MSSPSPWQEAKRAQLIEHCGGFLPEPDEEPYYCSCGSTFCSPQSLAGHCETTGHAPEGAEAFEDGAYGVPEGICFSLPCTCEGGEWSVIKDLSIDSFSQEKLKTTLDELLAEKKMAEELLAASA